MSSEVYTVKQGETVASIARQYGFANWRKIWELPENDEIRSKRGNPNILAVGDKVNIPEKQIKDHAGKTETKNRFRLKSDKLFLNIRIEDAGWDPVENEKYTLDIGTKTIQGKTDRDGLLAQEIPVDLKIANLVIRGHTFVLKIGSLDPVQMVSGWSARLKNLGYFDKEVSDEINEEVLAAAEEYQCDAGLKVDGIVGQRTQDQLEKDHGN